MSIMRELQCDCPTVRVAPVHERAGHGRAGEVMRRPTGPRARALLLAALLIAWSIVLYAMR